MLILDHRESLNATPGLGGMLGSVHYFTALSYSLVL